MRARTRSASSRLISIICLMIESFGMVCALFINRTYKCPRIMRWRTRMCPTHDFEV